MDWVLHLAGVLLWVYRSPRLLALGLLPMLSGALAGVVGTIGIKDTPVRAMIHAAVRRLQTPITQAALVVEGHDLCGIFVGGLFAAWSAAAFSA